MRRVFEDAIFKEYDRYAIICTTDHKVIEICRELPEAVEACENLRRKHQNRHYEIFKKLEHDEV